MINTYVYYTKFALFSVKYYVEIEIKIANYFDFFIWQQCDIIVSCIKPRDTVFKMSVCRLVVISIALRYYMFVPETNYQISSDELSGNK